MKLSPSMGGRGWTGVIIAAFLIGIHDTIESFGWWALILWYMAFWALPIELIRVDAIDRYRERVAEQIKELRRP